MAEAGSGGTAGPEEASLRRFLTATDARILARLERVEGSAPRDEGTFMLIGRNALFGTIGGGFAEFETIAHARRMLDQGEAQDMRTLILGPDTGQCCGGRLSIAFDHVNLERAEALLAETRRMEEERRPVMLFGAGHVGKALAQALAPLPLAVSVVETRPEELALLPPGVRSVATALPEAELARLPAEAAAIILTHDHALDFLIAREALNRKDLAYVGMIGSATKRATFAGQWKRDGGDMAILEKLVLPIGGTEVKDKRPAVIAALVAAEILRLPSYGVSARSARDGSDQA